jgi:hypothetical protein
VLGAGCGSSSDFVATSSGSGPSLPADQLVFGRVKLDAPPTGAVARLTDLTGSPLGFPSATVDSSGNFRIPASIASLPEEFRVEVRLTGSSPWNLPIVANARNYTEQDAVYCNILTTAAALYRAQEGSTQEQAEARIRTLFGLPSGIDIASGVDESRRSPFRHEEFLRQAASQGGVEAYLLAVLDGAPIAAQFGELAGAVALGVIADLGADVVTDGLGKLAQSLGLNIGKQAEINQANEDLTNIQNQLTQLTTDLQADFNTLNAEIRADEALTLLTLYNTLSTSLVQPTSELTTRTQDLRSAVESNPITNGPFSPSQQVQGLLTEIAAFNAEDQLLQISDVLFGSSNTSLLVVYRQLLGYRTGNALMPGASNPLFYDFYERFFTFYAQQQTLGLNLLVENANLILDAGTIDTARQTAGEVVADQVLEFQYLGFPLASDFYLTNPQAAYQARTNSPNPPVASGTVYYTQLQGATYAYNQRSIYLASTYTDSDGNLVNVQASDQGIPFRNSCQSYSEPGYPSAGFPNGWRLPSLGELTQLRALALNVNPNSAVDGLVDMGFVVPDDWDGTVWFLELDNTLVNGEAVENNTNPNAVPEYFGVDQDQYIKVFNFNDASTYGYDAQSLYDQVWYAQRHYLVVHYQSADVGSGAEGSYQTVVAAGFRPTAAPTITLSGSRLTATLSNGENVTPYVSWTSSNPAQLEVIGNGTSEVTLLWHPGSNPAQNLTAQTITGRLQGMSSTGSYIEHASTLNVPVPSPLPTRTLKSILPTPSNQILTSTATATQFFATAFYDDNSVEDVSNLVTWSLELPDGLPYPPGEATITGNVKGALVFKSPVIVDPAMVIRATLGSISGTTQLEVAD